MSSEALGPQIGVSVNSCCVPGLKSLPLHSSLRAGWLLCKIPPTAARWGVEASKEAERPGWPAQTSKGALGCHEGCEAVPSPTGLRRRLKCHQRLIPLT